MWALVMVSRGFYRGQHGRWALRHAGRGNVRYDVLASVSEVLSWRLKATWQARLRSQPLDLHKIGRSRLNTTARTSSAKRLGRGLKVQGPKEQWPFFLFCRFKLLI